MCNREYDKHHRLPRGHKDRKEKRFVVRVRRSQHQAWHILTRGSFDPHEAAEIINRYFIHPEYELVVRRRNG